MEQQNMYKVFPITSITRRDVIHAFDNSDDLESVIRKVLDMDDSEMKDLARKMGDDYCEQLFWNSLTTIFKERFLK